MSYRADKQCAVGRTLKVHLKIRNTKAFNTHTYVCVAADYSMLIFKSYALYIFE